MQKSFRTRKTGTPKQVGQKFPVIEKKQLPPKIRISGTARATVPKFTWEEIDPPVEQIKSRQEIARSKVPTEIVNQMEDFVGDPENLSYRRGILKGAPVFIVFEGQDYLATFKRTMAAKTPAEQKVAKKRWKYQAMPHKTKEEIKAVVEKAIKKAAKKKKKIALDTSYEQYLKDLGVKPKDVVKSLKAHARIAKTKKEIPVPGRGKKWYKDPVTGKWKKIKKAPAEIVEIAEARQALKAAKVEKKQIMKDKLKKQIAKKVAAVKYPVSERGPSYQKYLGKLRRRSKWKKRAKLYSVPLVEAEERKKIKKARKK